MGSKSTAQVVTLYGGVRCGDGGAPQCHLGRRARSGPTVAALRRTEDAGRGDKCKPSCGYGGESVVEYYSRVPEPGQLAEKGKRGEGG